MNQFTRELLYIGLPQLTNNDRGEFDDTAGKEVFDNFDNSAIPSGMTFHQIPPAQYAIFTVSLSREDVTRDMENAYNYIMGTWLPVSTYSCDAGF